MSRQQLRSIILLLSFSFLSIIFFFIVINQLLLSNETENVILKNAKTTIQAQEKILITFLNRTTDQIASFNTFTYFQDFMETRKSKKIVQEYFLSVAQSDTTIMQIRFIDKDGLEQIRVDRETLNTVPRLISDSELQDKSKRDYFVLSKDKPANRIWLSDLDLNMEHGEVEKPFKPTLRAILPLKHEDKFEGILVINYFMQPILDDLSDMPLYDVIIVDKNGDTLVHYDDKKSWSAYSSQKNNLKHLLPEHFQSILENTVFNAENIVSEELHTPLDQVLFSVLTLKKDFLEETENQIIKRIAKELVLLAFIAFLIGILLAKRFQTIFNETEEILKRKKIFNDTFDNAAVGIAHVGLDGQWIRTNRILSKILGYSTDELLSLTFQEITYHDDLDTDLKYLNETLLGQINTYKIEKRYLHKDGSIFWAKLTVSLIRDQHGSPEYFIFIIDDISERKKLQANISAYLDLIDTHIITSKTDLKGRITEVSEAFCAISGYTKEELIGQSHSILRHPDMPAELYQDLWKTIKADTTWYGEIKNRKKDGGYYWVKATIAPRYNDKNVKIGYTAIRQVITTKKALEENKIKLQKSFEELQKTQNIIVSQSRIAAMGEIMRMIAHQWRQPLSVISSKMNHIHLSSQLGTLSLDTVGEQIEKLQSDIQALSSIINSFRNCCGSENEHSTIPFSEITNTVISLKNDRLAQNNITLNTQLDKAAQTLQYNKQLIQVLISVISNSIESLQKHNIQEKKILLKTQKAEGHIILSVCDNGEGIENEILHKVFEPYFSTKENLNGKGLGLYTSKIIIDNVIKGSIDIENIDGGVCVKIVLPIPEV